jgi:hypothetical protein
MSADLNNPPDVNAWVSGGAATATETPPAEVPVVETPPAPPEVPPAETPPVPPAPPEPSPAEAIVSAMVKAGMKQEDATALFQKATTPQPIKDALEAYLDGKPYPVPKSLTFKLKSGTTERQATLEQLQREGMLATDYQRKTQELAQQRREHQRQVAEWTARDAALKEREKWFDEQRQEMLLAQKDPKKWEEYQEIQRLRSQSPAFDKLFQDAMKAREDGATRGVLEQVEREQQIAEGVETVVDTIRSLASEYPEVNPERVRIVLAYALQSGQLTDTPESVRQVYEGERQYLQGGPAAAEVARLKAENDALKAAKDAEAHNAQTARVLQRNKAPNTAPAGGAPAGPAKVEPPKPIPPNRQAIDQAISDWSKRRDE